MALVLEMRRITQIAETLVKEQRAENAEGHVPIVLVVEDNYGDAFLMLTGLWEMGCWVSWARSGEEALRKAHGMQRLDMIFIDLGLPGMTGAQLLDKLRRQFPSVPIVIVTGASPDFVAREIQDSGCQVVQKPLKGEDFEAMLKDKS